MKGCVSLRDIAAQAGVSHMTVSRALNNHPSVSNELGVGIRAIADRLGYRRDAEVSRIMSAIGGRRSLSYRETIGLLLCEPKRRESVASLKPFVRLVREHAASLGYGVDEFWARERGGRQISAVLRARGIRGVLLSPPMHAKHAHLSLTWEHFAAVTIGSSLWRPQLHRAQSHHYQDMVTALQEMRRLGFRRIGLALDDLTDSRSNFAYRGSFLVHQAARQQRSPSLVLVGRAEEDKFMRWFDREDPAAILCNPTFTPLRDWLVKRGVRVPGDVSLACLDCAYIPGWAGIVQPHTILPLRAVELLIGLLQRHEMGIPRMPQQIMIIGEWRPGDTAVRNPAPGSPPASASAKTPQ